MDYNLRSPGGLIFPQRYVMRAWSQKRAFAVVAGPPGFRILCDRPESRLNCGSSCAEKKPENVPRESFERQTMAKAGKRPRLRRCPGTNPAFPFLPLPFPFPFGLSRAPSFSAFCLRNLLSWWLGSVLGGSQKLVAWFFVFPKKQHHSARTRGANPQKPPIQTTNEGSQASQLCFSHLDAR